MCRYAQSVIPHRRLTNGAMVADRRDQQQSWLAIGLWARAGSRFERDEQRGWAHLMEHLWFRGGALHDAATVDALCDRLGGHINAETGRELIGLWGLAPANQWRELATLLTDLFVRPRFDTEALAIERDIVRSELTLVPTPSETAIHDLLRHIWPDHPLGRSISGDTETLRGADATALHQWHREHIIGPRVAAVVMGGNAEFALSVVADALDELPATAADDAHEPLPPRIPHPPPAPEVPDQPGELIWAVPLAGWYDPAYLHDELGLIALTGGLGAILPARLRRELGLVYNAFGDAETAFDARVGLIVAQTSSLRATAQAAEAEMQAVAEGGIPEAAVSHASAQLTAQQTLAKTQPVDELRRTAWELLANTIPGNGHAPSTLSGLNFEPQRMWRSVLVASQR